MPVRIVNPNTRIDFLGRNRRLAALSASCVLICAALLSIITQGLALGIDFTGGVLLEVGYSQPADLDRIRGTLVNAGFDGALVQRFGNETDVLVRLPPQDSGDAREVRQRLEQTLLADSPSVDIRRVELVGPQVGEDLTEQGGLAMIIALLMIFAYVMLRFQWKFAAGAVAALIHDVVVTIGFFSWFQIEFDLAVVAAILAVIGYSLNDTVVEFDRMRENFLGRRGMDAEELMNLSTNEVLARTLITGLTTLLVLVALLLFGGEALAPFATALIVGVVIGTYSSIYIASAVALCLDVTARDMMPPVDDQASDDDLP